MRINPNAKVWVERAANLFPILYVDDFYTDPDAVRDLALSLDFEGIRALYPGRHVFLNELGEQRPDIAEAVRGWCDYVRTLVINAAGMRIPDNSVVTDFSMISTPARNLVKGQKHPHIDGTPVLSIIYLNPEDMGGTSFYHNIPLGFAAVVTDEQRAAAAQFVENAPLGPEIDGYKMAFPDIWRKIHTIPARYNRFVCYPGNIFHWVECHAVPEPFDKRLARLTQRYIIQEMKKTPEKQMMIGGNAMLR